MALSTVAQVLLHQQSGQSPIDMATANLILIEILFLDDPKVCHVTVKAN